MATAGLKCAEPSCNHDVTTELRPCGHVVCREHAHEFEEGHANKCASCEETVQAVSPISDPYTIVDITGRDVSDEVVYNPRARLESAMNVNRAPQANQNNNNSAPEGAQGNKNTRMPFYRGTDQAQMASQQGNESTVPGGARYVPPHMRQELDIVRPESSMSNITVQTFASQAPPRMSNYSYGPSQLTQNMSAYNPFNNARTPRATAQNVPRAGGNRAHGNMNVTPMQSGYTNAIVQPTPMRRDSGAGALSRSEYLANRIRAGHAEDPYDPDYGNPGPSKRPAPAPAMLAFPSQSPVGSGTGKGKSKAVVPKVDGKNIPENTAGNPKAFLGSDKVENPGWLVLATDAGNPPSIEQAFEMLPFIEACRYAVPSTAGVVKVENIPYATSRSEVNAFLGKQTQICLQPIGTGFHAVHIIMDRHSGKTMDAFVEVSTAHEAVWVVNQFQRRVSQNRPGKIGDRIVEIKLSNQDELMATLFPRAKNVTWEGGVPKVDPKIDTYYPGITSTGFIGFLQDEEIVHMQKHAETPQRSPFAQRCMIRTFECLISTLYKFPWFAHEYVLLKERDDLYNCVNASLRALINLLRKTHTEKPDTSKPTINTLAELATAIFVCPGFTEKQKNIIAKILHQSGFGKHTYDHALNLRFGGVGKFSDEVPFLALVKQPGVDDKVVEYFASLFADATTGMKPLSLADLHAMRASTGKDVTKNTFGELDIDYTGAKSIADAGRAELRYLEHILGRVLARKHASRAATGTGSRSSSLQLQ